MNTDLTLYDRVESTLDIILRGVCIECAYPRLVIIKIVVWIHTYEYDMI